jgi:hypothetical protein
MALRVTRWVVYLKSCYFQNAIVGLDDAPMRCRRLQHKYRWRDWDHKESLPARWVIFVTWTHWGFEEEHPHRMISPWEAYKYPPEACVEP